MALDEAVQEEIRIDGRLWSFTYLSNTCHEQILVPESKRVDFNGVATNPSHISCVIKNVAGEYVGRLTTVNYATEHEPLDPNCKTFSITWDHFVREGKPQRMVRERPAAYSIPEEQ